MHAIWYVNMNGSNYMKYNYVNWHHYIHVHGYIALSQVWVHVWLFTNFGERVMSLSWDNVQ